MEKKKLKKKILTHILQNGEKQISEKIFTKSLKSIQKFHKKSHSEIIKLALASATPIFKIVKLKNKKHKKNSVKEIPSFLFNYSHRTSWGIKYLIRTSISKKNKCVSNQLKFGILKNLSYEGNAVELKNKFQNTTLLKKTYLKYYRW